MNSKRVRVLVVDDEPAMRRALRATLSASGFAVEEARDGEEAIELVGQMSVSMVLLDSNMPGMGGVEACRRIRALAPNAGIVMITIRDTEDDKSWRSLATGLFTAANLRCSPRGRKGSIVMTRMARLPVHPTTRTLCVLASVLLVSVSAALAAPFQNLGFESAILIEKPVNFTLPTATLPFWTAGAGSYQFTNTLYDTLSTGGPAVSLQDGLDPYDNGEVIMQPLQGSYSVFCREALEPPADAWIAQTGDVPSNAKSLLFESDFSAGGFLTVSLDNTVVATSVLSTGETVNPNFGPIKTYIADVSAFAGQSNVTLEFDAANGVFADLDAISFSTVPEPSSLVLLAVGALSARARTCVRLAVSSLSLRNQGVDAGMTNRGRRSTFSETMIARAAVIVSSRSPALAGGFDHVGLGLQILTSTPPAQHLWRRPGRLGCTRFPSFCSGKSLCRVSLRESSEELALTFAERKATIQPTLLSATDTFQGFRLPGGGAGRCLRGPDRSAACYGAPGPIGETWCLARLGTTSTLEEDRGMRIRFTIVAGIIGLALSGAATTGISAVYVVTDLGSLGYGSYASAINSSGQIVGTAYLDSGHRAVRILV